MAVSLYLIYIYYFVGLCLGHCNPFNYSLGLIWFTIGIFVDRFGRRWVDLWSIAGIIGVAYFVLLETIEGFCEYCTILHALGLTAIAFAQKNRQK
jgi:uncharacterized membrane protein